MTSLRCFCPAVPGDAIGHRHYITDCGVQYSEKFSGQVKVKEVFSTKYLGEIISSDGSNTQNVTDRRNRGFGTVKEILKMLDTMYNDFVQFWIITIKKINKKNVGGRGQGKHDNVLTKTDFFSPMASPTVTVVTATLV